MLKPLASMLIPLAPMLMPLAPMLITCFYVNVTCFNVNTIASILTSIGLSQFVRIWRYILNSLPYYKKSTFDYIQASECMLVICFAINLYA